MCKYKIKDGDWVVCRNSMHSDLVTGEMYEVEYIDLNGYVKLCGIDNYYNPDRFESLSTAITGVPIPEVPTCKPPEKQLLEIKYAGMTVTLDPAKMDSKKFATNIIDAIYEQGE